MPEKAPGRSCSMVVHTGSNSYSRHTLKSVPALRVRLCLSAHKMRCAPSMKHYRMAASLAALCRSVEKKPMLLFKRVDYNKTMQSFY